jgi:hypothetical protein
VQDPSPLRGDKRVQTEIATTVDVLEADLSRNHISEGAYSVGRALQQLWEHADGQRIGSTWRDGVGGGGSSTEGNDRKILRLIVNAKTIRMVQDELAQQIGEVGVRFLRRCLIGGRPYAAVAADEGKSGERGTAYVADRCRWLLEQLSKTMPRY